MIDNRKIDDYNGVEIFKFRCAQTIHAAIRQSLEEGAAMGIVIGAVFGALQLSLLVYGVKYLSAGRLKVWPFLLQFFCPLGGLLACAFLARKQLLVCACIICGILIVGAVIVWTRWRKKDHSEKKV